MSYMYFTSGAYLNVMHFFVITYTLNIMTLCKWKQVLRQLINIVKSEHTAHINLKYCNSITITFDIKQVTG